MVDLDEKVVEVSLKHLPQMHGGCMEDPRLEVVYGDAKAWIENTKLKFDVVIMDICDPVEAGPGIVCYFQEHYDTIKSKMNPGGIFVTQSGGAGVLTYEECFTVINRTLRASFPFVAGFKAEVPSFGSPWGFNLACKDGPPRDLD